MKDCEKEANERSGIKTRQKRMWKREEKGTIKKRQKNK